MSVQVQSFFHRDSNTFSYLVSDPASSEAALIDPGPGLRPGYRRQQ